MKSFGRTLSMLAITVFAVACSEDNPSTGENAGAAGASSGTSGSGGGAGAGGGATTTDASMDVGAIADATGDGNSSDAGRDTGTCTASADAAKVDAFTFDVDGSFKTALPIPPVLAPTSSDMATDRYELTVRPGMTAMRAGNLTPIVGFNGIAPGPTIIATKGKAVEVKQTNGWTENITIHNHGHKVAASSDGHPVDYIAPGASKTYFYPNDQRAGTYWYHDHAMDLTGPHVYAGIAAFYIIHDPAEDALHLPSGSYDVPLLLQDKSFNADNTLVYQVPGGPQGFTGDTAVVNGVAAPYFEVATHKYRFRVLNGSNARTFQIGLQSGKSFQVIASDGGLLAAPLSMKSLSIAPAERYDIVVDFSGAALGSTDVLTNQDAGQFNGALPTLLQFRVTTPACDDSVVPATLSSVQRLAEGDSKGTFTLRFAQTNQDWTLNGLTYDPARVDVTSKAGEAYIWQLTNQSNVVHPFHKHLVQFNVLDIDGVQPPPEQQGWKDTVQVPTGSTVRIIFRADTVPDKNQDAGAGQTFVLHCHILEHEDHRMMLQESVTP
jgi:FtsP/CotA-like multicopper oxidase with cupredoxin domain